MPLVDRAIVLDLGKVLVEAAPDIVRDRKSSALIWGSLSVHESPLPIGAGSDLGGDYRGRHGRIVRVAGANGAGKSTLLKSIVWRRAPRSGIVTFDGTHRRHGAASDHRARHRRCAGKPPAVSRLRCDNCGSAAILSRPNRSRRRRWCSRCFRASERLEQRAETLSGGGSRCWRLAARYDTAAALDVDEPSQGIMPKLVDDLCRGQGKSATPA